MNKLSLSDIKAFNADLLSAYAAGVPLAFEHASLSQSAHAPASLDSTRNSLLEIERRVAAAEFEGHGLEWALQKEAVVAPRYVWALRTWHQTNRSPDALDAMVAASMSGWRRRWKFRVSSVQPLIWLTVGYIALLLISLVIAPLFLAVNRQMWAQPGFMLSLLLTVRDWLPVWGLLFPLLLVAIWFTTWRSDRRRMNGPGDAPSSESIYSEKIRRVQLARHAAQLLEQGVPMPEVVAGMRELEQRGLARPAAANGNQPPRLPPLIQWAVERAAQSSQASPATSPAASSAASAVSAGGESVGDTESRGMRLVANIYAGMAQALAERQQPTPRTRVRWVLLGGLWVLGIALCVFGPLLELLYFVALPARS